MDDPQDRDTLKVLMFEKKIKAQKRLAMIQDGLSAVPLEQGEGTSDEYEAFLKLAYTAEMSSSPDSGMPREELEKKLRETILITDSELRLLALNRAKSVKAYILKDNKVEPGRLFLTEAPTLSPASTDQYQAGRVELSLQ